MTINLDIASVLSAVLWPVVVLVILLVFRKRIPALVEGVASRVTKLEFAGISLELAVAKPFVPEWSGPPGALDLRHRATAMQVNDSTARTFIAQLQLTEEGTADYAQVNLGTGEEWLTSRLFIMAIVLARMKGIKCFVFVETSGSVRKRYVGWAEPEKIRWALAKRYPLLEQGYTGAYSALTSQQDPLIVSNQGRLGYQHSPDDPGLSIELLKEFLERVQAPPLPSLLRAIRIGFCCAIAYLTPTSTPPGSAARNSKRSSAAISIHQWFVLPSLDRRTQRNNCGHFYRCPSSLWL